MPLVDACHPAGRRPNIIMIHDESSFDIRAAQSIKVPPGYGARDVEPDSFFYDKALRLVCQQPPNKPLFTFIYLGVNHFPWETRFRPDLMPAWRPPGNLPPIDEYLRRQAMSAEQYKAFVAGLKKNFPGEPFLIVRCGDHEPEFAPSLLEPGLDQGAIGKKLDAYDPRLYATYYAIDAVNFEPVGSEAVMDTIDGPYLPLVIQEAAGIPLDASFAAQKEDHAPLRGHLLRLQGRCRGTAAEPVADRCVDDQGAVENWTGMPRV